MSEDLIRCSWLIRDGVTYERCKEITADDFCEDHRDMPESHLHSALLACGRSCVSVGQVVKAARAECGDEFQGHGFSADIQGGQVCVVTSVGFVEIHRDRLFDSYEDHYPDPSAYTYNDLLEADDPRDVIGYEYEYSEQDYPFQNVRPVVTVRYSVQDFSCPCPETLPICTSTFTDPDDDLFEEALVLDDYDYEELTRIATPLELLAWQSGS